jgi:hypothetical protein
MHSAFWHYTVIDGGFGPTVRGNMNRELLAVAISVVPLIRKMVGEIITRTVLLRDSQARKKRLPVL